MGLVCLPTIWVIFYGFHVGKYTVRPMDPSWDKLLFVLKFQCVFSLKNTRQIRAF